MFVKPSPYWNACTASSGIMPSVSAIGARIGTRIAALEDADGIIMLTTEITRVIPTDATARGRPIRGRVIQ